MKRWTRANHYQNAKDAATRNGPPGNSSMMREEICAFGIADVRGTSEDKRSMKVGLRCPTWLLALSALVVGLATTAPAFARDWLPASDLSTVGANADKVKSAVDSAGNVTAVWRHVEVDNVTIQTAFRSAATGGWTAPRNISATDSTISLPALAVDGSGGATVIWRRFDGNNYIIEGATRSSQGTWGPVQAISQTGENAYEPDVAMDSGGTAIAVWRRLVSASGPWVIQSSRRPSGGGWETPTTLSAEVGGDAFYPHVAVDTAGNAAASWRRNDGSNFVVQVSSRPIGSGWSSPTTLSQSGQDAWRPWVALSPNGDAVVTWRRSDGTSSVIQASYRKGLSGAWQAAPDTISQTGRDADSPRPAIDATGAVTVVWSRDDGLNTIIQSSTRPASGPWGPVQNLSEAGRDADLPDVAVDPAGNAVAVWMRFDGSNDIIQAATRPTGGLWQELRDLSAPGRSGTEPRVAIAANGTAAAVWSRSDGTNLIAQVSVRSNVGPTLLSLSIPAVAKVKTPVTFSVQTAPGPYSLPSDPVWTFGDGSTATGYAVSHVYQNIGNFTVSVSQSDSAGNPIGAQRQLQVTGDLTPNQTNRLVQITSFRAKPPIFHTRSRATCVRTKSKRVTCKNTKAGTFLLFRSSVATRLNIVVRNGKSKRVLATFAVKVKKGANQVRFQGKVRGKRLPAGTYIVTIAPRPPATIAPNRRLTIKIKILR